MINIPADHLRHTRFAQDWIKEGRQEGEALGRMEGEARGRAAEAAAVALRLVGRRCGAQSEATIARIQALPLDQLEELTDALLDYRFAGLRLQRPC